MPDQEMIDRVAKAIYEKHPKFKYENLNNSSKIDLQHRAKTAIEAMREPTKTMLAAENVHAVYYTCGGHEEGWQAMIDAILK